jgi:hypothetical protein
MADVRVKQSDLRLQWRGQENKRKTPSASLCSARKVQKQPGGSLGPERCLACLGAQASNQSNAMLRCFRDKLSPAFQLFASVCRAGHQMTSFEP